MRPGCERGRVRGWTGSGAKLRRILSDRSASVVVVERRDGLARWGGRSEATAAADGRGEVAADRGEATDGLGGDMVEVLTCVCARLPGRRGARDRAMRAVTAARHRAAAASG